MKNYNKLIISFVFIIGAVVGHGFPTLYQYIESLSGDYISNETSRNEILNSDIQTGEPMKASVINAKFNSLKHELDDLGSRITNVEGMSGPITVKKSLACTSARCFFILNGVGDGTTSGAQDYLVVVSSASAQIVEKYVAPSTQVNNTDASAFDDTIYPQTFVSGDPSANLDSSRIKASEIDLSSFRCSDRCYFVLNGVGDGTTTGAQDYLVNVSSSSAQIVERYVAPSTQVNNTDASSFDDTVYPQTFVSGDPNANLDSSRLKFNEIQLIE